MSNQPSPVPRDDAAIFSLNTASDDVGDETDSEDPLGKGKGASPIGQLDMFRATPPKVVGKKVTGGNKEPRAGGFQLTQGAKSCPEIGPGTALRERNS